MTQGQKTALYAGGGLVLLYLLMNAKPKTTMPAQTVGYPSGTGGTTVALAGIGAGVSIIDNLTNALAGQQTSDASGGAYYGF